MSAFPHRLTVATATALAAFGFALAHATSADAQTYVACGYGTTVTLGSGGSSCMTLPDAVSAAESHFGADTIEMLPGSYCPIDLEGNLYDSIAFEGAGIAGIDTSGGPITINGPEAGLTTFKYDSLHCGDSVPNAVVKVDAFVNPGPGIQFENLTIDGGGAGGPGYGLFSQGNGVDVSMRDVIVQNATTEGVFYQSGFSAFHDYSLDVSHSAILDNGTGVDIVGFGSVYASTLAGNTTGVALDGDVSLGSDTIAHNTYGATSPCCGHDVQVVNTINADNTTADCQQSVDWESQSSGHNLLSDVSCFPRAGTDIVDTSVTLAAVDEIGGPTPSILAPSAAQGQGDSVCGLDGVDQREFVISGTCDIGAVQQGADGTAAVATPDVALGEIDTGTTVNATVDVSNNGGDVQGVSHLSISGAGWSIADDGCTYEPLAHDQFCAISVAVTPTTDGPWPGTLTVETTAGTKHVALTASAVTRATGEDDAYDVTGASLTVPAPGILGNDQAGVSYDEVVTQPTNGTLTGPLADGSFTYTPNDAFVGVDSFQYTVIDDGLAESHPITVTLHVLGFTVSLGAPSYSTDPGGSFILHVTVTPAHGFAGDVCLDVADANGDTWPSYLSPQNGYGDCSATDENTGANVPLSGAAVIVDLPIDVASNATPGAFPLEILASAESAPSYAQSFELDLGAINPPVIASYTPVNVGVGTHVKIYGSAFTGTTAVAFNGVAASDFSVDADNTITAIVASGTTSGKITVTTPLGTATSANPYTFFAQPTITGLSATTADVGSTVMVNGTSLNGATSVTLLGTQVPFSVVSSAEITFTIPAAAATGTVTVVTPGGSATSSASIVVGLPPTITGFSPGSGPVGTPVTITGTHLDHTVGVEIGGIITVPTSVSPTQVVFSIPPGAAGGTIKILATNGSVTSVDTFTVTG